MMAAVAEARRGSGKAGITLLELVMALTIIALAVGVAVPAFLGLYQRDDLAKATLRVQTLFRLARDSAISSGLPVTVVIDSVSELVWIDTPKRIQLGSVEEPQAPVSLFDEEMDAADLALLGGEGVLEALVPGEPIGLPEGIRMELPRARARFTFDPTGSALADTLLLSGPFGTRVLTIDAWTGDVRVY
ncbi:MAG: GspH/FimT family pseudopilin [Gemmatimonadota bacterium]|jgi:type II secretory pathway pseudopilin PulG